MIEIGTPVGWPRGRETAVLGLVVAEQDEARGSGRFSSVDPMT